MAAKRAGSVDVVVILMILFLVQLVTAAAIFIVHVLRGHRLAAILNEEEDGMRRKMESFKKAFLVYQRLIEIPK